MLLGVICLKDLWLLMDWLTLSPCVHADGHMPLFFDSWLKSMAQKDATLLADMAYLPQYGHLLPKCSPFVHHGSSTTTAAALTAGLPHIILPVTSEQTTMVSCCLPESAATALD